MEQDARSHIIKRMLIDIDQICPLAGTFRDGRPAFDDIRNHERWTLNPLRNDSHCGSFSINLQTGVWNDFAETGAAKSGSIIDLYAALFGESFFEIREKYSESTARVVQRNQRPDHTYTYYNEQGEEAFSILRWDSPDGKKIRPSHRSLSGELIYGYPKGYKENRPLFHLNSVLSSGNKNILVVEGEKACVAAETLFPNMVVTTWSGGAQAYRKTNWEPLTGKKVILWPDADKPGIEAMHAISSIIAPIASSICILNVSDNSDKWDAADLYAEIGDDTVKANLILQQMILDGSSQKREYSHIDQDDSGRETASSSRKSLADKLLALIEDSDAVELWRNQEGNPCITSVCEQVTGSWAIDDTVAIEALLRYLWMRQYPRKTVPTETLKTVQSTIRTRAVYANSAEYRTAIRVAGDENEVFIDIGDPSWDIVHITRNGWKIVSGFEGSVRFLRPNGFKPLPRPLPGGNLASLKDLLNVPDDDTWALVAGWIIGCFNPSGPYPGLIINGPQGSAKSTMTRILKELTDPHQASLRRTPRNESDIAIAAQNSRVLAYDNLSGIKKDLSDLFCIISTGGSFTTRKLYSNSAETILSFCQPWILNGIDEIASRGDLADRAIILDLPVIPDDKRKTETEIMVRFNELKPYLFGSICDAVYTALYHKATAKLAYTPRMIDFATWVVAAESRMGIPEGQFLAAYKQNREEYQIDTAEHDSMVHFIDAVLLRDCDEWIGSSTELFQKLQEYIRSNNEYRTDYPRTPVALTQALKRKEGILRQLGIIQQRDRTNRKRLRVITRKSAMQDTGGNDTSE